MGFTNAVKLVMRLRPGGLLWMAVVCSSFVFTSSSNTHRTLDNPEARGHWALQLLEWVIGATRTEQGASS